MLTTTVCRPTVVGDLPQAQQNKWQMCRKILCNLYKGWRAPDAPNN
ncbi:hypothetical protein RvY_14115 [Ramazzottius varieornatus]|uniref:Uncharacterized protein n=1 Tax=Ramazzottius varieornatus TaxID=947166 RepID=A0A1D1VQ69_RAMVA|nr:hypothetical protein RvY_14115 [Ramazzottius varieornatus]